MKMLLTSVLLLLLTNHGMAAEQLRVTVLDASSANYLKVQTGDGKTRWIRLAGILCEEPETYYGNKARRLLLDRTQGKKVRLKLGGIDENGIRMAAVFHSFRQMNALLLQEGLCQLDPEAEPNTFLERAQKIAIVRKNGRWGPMPTTAVQEEDRIAEHKQEREDEGGFDNQAFFYTISGMGFLALMIMISRKRAIALKKEQKEKEMAQLIRKKNEEAGPSVIPVDLTSSVLMAPRRPSQGANAQPLSPHDNPAQRAAYGNEPEAKGTGFAEQDPLLASLTEEEKTLLENLDEEERKRVLETLRNNTA